MGKSIFFAAKSGKGLYLQGVDINEHYSRTGTAPTMGVRHSYNEYKTVWGKEFKCFDYRTLAGYMNIYLSETFWGDAKPQTIKIIPCDADGNEVKTK